MAEALPEVKVGNFYTGGRITYKVTKWTTQGLYQDIYHESRVPTDAAEADVISSELVGSTLQKPVIDVDLPIRVYPSSTLGHFHLYIDHPMTWRRYRRLLKAMVKAGLVEPGYYAASKARKASHVRLPWRHKD